MILLTRIRIFIYRYIRRIKKIFFVRKKIEDDKEYLTEFCKMALNYKVDLDNPVTFNEKLNWYKLNYRNDLMVKVVDKYEVRDYIKSKGLERILLKNYGVFSNINDVDLNYLPEQFVVKVTGDSGGVLLCRNKETFIKKAYSKFSNIDVDYSHINKEWPYHYIKNRIIIEEILDTSDGKAPKDYKIFCFNGEPKFLFVASERETECKFDFYDLDWNWINVRQGHPNSKNGIERPEKLEEMIEISKILSKDFPHVRVDLYYENGNIYFGELTFFHFSGTTPFWPRKYDYEFGKYFDVSKIKSIN